MRKVAVAYATESLGVSEEEGLPADRHITLGLPVQVAAV